METGAIICAALIFTAGVKAFEPLFEARIYYNVGEDPGSVVAADFDGDGQPDLATANYYSADVSILRNDGEGAFEPAINYQTGYLPVSIFATDLDGDGDNDLTMTSYNANDVSKLKNNGNRTF